MNPAVISAQSAAAPDEKGRVVTAGKFFARGGAKLFLRAVSYGPFSPNARGEPFPDDELLQADISQIRSLGFNAIRLYELPTPTLLRAVEVNELLIVAGVPWSDHVDFLSDSNRRRSVETAVHAAATALSAEKSVAALLVGNEIEKTLVRWLGPLKVRSFLEGLITIAKEAAPEMLVSYATYPSTEYLSPRNADFFAINVYLEESEAFERYLLRLQNLTGNKPLMISEFGLDARSHGESQQAETLRWQHEALQKAGVAGNVWFSFTDDWHRGGEKITGWNFGIVDRARIPRAAARVAHSLRNWTPTGACTEPRTSEPSSQLRTALPRISAIVCTRNGSLTLSECLAALGRQTHPNHEVIVIDDGSTDSTSEIAMSFPFVRYFHQAPAGLSAARNRGAHEADGEILAYTDDDCIPDEDWLARLSAAYDDESWVAAGGPNIPPAPRNHTEAIVAAAPGAPTHVLIADEEAEHLPGCNLSIRKAALLAVGGFRDEFVTAGDDVDICWRLREAGGRLRFVAAAMVWHHRRFTVRDYFRQQSGYGHAEALLMKHHPSRFGPLGGARWRGAIYGDGLGLREPVEGSVYHGQFGLAPFQAIYPQGITAWWEIFFGVLWVALAALALLLRAPWVALLFFAGSLWAAWQRERRSLAEIATRGVPSRSLLGFLCWLQPIVREGSRLRGMLALGARPNCGTRLPDIFIPRRPKRRTRRIASLAFWSETDIGREQWLDAMRRLLEEEKVPFRDDDGWHDFDLEMHPGYLVTYGFLSVTEYHGGSRKLTRVALVRRVRWQVVIPLLVAFWLLTTRTAALFGFHGDVIAVGVIVFLAATSLFMGRVFGVNLVHQAAERMGLKRMEG